MCRGYVGEPDIFITQNMTDHERTAAKVIIQSYRKRESRLFWQNADGTMTRRKTP